jgi:hypothetical protein
MKRKREIKIIFSGHFRFTFVDGIDEHVENWVFCRWQMQRKKGLVWLHR